MKCNPRKLTNTRYTLIGALLNELLFFVYRILRKLHSRFSVIINKFLIITIFQLPKTWLT